MLTYFQFSSTSEWSLVDQARESDSQLVNALGVDLICDLMVEMRKSAYGMTYVSVTAIYQLK